jgi:amidase
MSGELRLQVVEAGLADLRRALDAGVLTCVELVARYLDRIGAYDRHGPRLNAVVELNPAVFAEARASDARRAAGRPLGPLDGIPFTAKDSYSASGMTVAAGSPAFAGLVAGADAYAVGRLRAGGAVLIGLTNMPPLANGGMQRGLYGRAESPYNEEFLASAYASGSSNGSGVATAASLAAFGLAEETWSSGRAPASNNALVAYTPSRGVVSMRGNWPLVPTMDVVVPHTRTMDDLLEVLDVLVADDLETRGDFWRAQPWIPVPAASAMRPPSYPSLADPDALRGKRLGVPRMYIGRDADADVPIETRPSVLELWERALTDLEALGAEVVETDFPAVSNYERDRPGAPSIADRGLVPPEYLDRELWDLSIWALDDFLQANGDPALHRLADADPARIAPLATGSLPDRYGEYDFDPADYVHRARRGVPASLTAIPGLAGGLRGLDETRRLDVDEWMAGLGLDAVVFPAVADVGRADADVDEAAARDAWRNGVWVANGNLVPRHLGLPTVTVPMGVMADTRMPVGLTLLGRAFDDTLILRFATALAASRDRRVPPPRTPPLPQDCVVAAPRPPADRSAEPPSLDVEARALELTQAVRIEVRGTARVGAGPVELRVAVNGTELPVRRDGDRFSAVVDLPVDEHAVAHTEWRGPYGSLVVVTAVDRTGAAVGAYRVVGGV